MAVFDLSTDAEVPSDLVGVDGERRLRFLAAGVPPVGYKVFELRRQAPFGVAQEVFVVGENMIENADFKVTLDGRGAITSLIDKRLDAREFVRVVNGRAMNVLGPGSGTVSLESAGPVGPVRNSVCEAGFTGVSS